MDARIAVYDPEFPDIELMTEINIRDLTATEREQAVTRLANQMWKRKCHYGLIITPKDILVLKRLLGGVGPRSIQVTHTLPTRSVLRDAPQSEFGDAKLLQRVWEVTVEDWLELLRDSYEQALPKDRDAANAFFPDIVGAVAGGRIVTDSAS